jgi:hypothetical protein
MSKNKQAGKGDKPRNCFSKQYKDNFDKIKWRTKKPDSEIRNPLYKDILDNLMLALTGGTDLVYTVSDKSKVSDFDPSLRMNQRLELLIIRFNLKQINNDERILDIVKRMYNYMPF